jgi:hypothetical protein
LLDMAGFDITSRVYPTCHYSDGRNSGARVAVPSIRDFHRLTRLMDARVTPAHDGFKARMLAFSA